MVGDATSGFWRVRLACDDPEDGGFASGCARIEYGVDGGAVAEYAGTVAVTGVGTHTVQWRGVDAAGNAEAFQTVSLEIVPPLPPTIDGFTPTSGPVGTAVTITGTNLDDVTAVTFHGVAASFTIVSPAELSATVPAGATTGPIAVSGPGGTATSASDFGVGDPPSVTDFSPASGGVGGVVSVKARTSARPRESHSTARAPTSPSSRRRSCKRPYRPGRRAVRSRSRTRTARGRAFRRSRSCRRR